jgi:hypothetical protein
VANSTAGRLFPLGDFGVTDHLRYNSAAISGAGPNRLFPTGDFATPDWLRYNAAALSGSGVGVTAKVYGVLGPWLQQYVGVYTLSGHTVLAGVPFRALVLLFPEESPSLCIRSMVTEADGVFSFTKLSAGRYTVLGIDLTDVYNGVVFCMVVAIP